MIQTIETNKTDISNIDILSRPRIELGSPQPQCGILTTILSRLLVTKMLKYTYMYHTHVQTSPHVRLESASLTSLEYK